MASWKEIAILIILARLILAEDPDFKIVKGKFPLLLIGCFLITTFFYFIASSVKSDAIVSAKMYVTPVLYGFCGYKLLLTKRIESRIVNVIFVSALISFAIAHIQNYLLKIPFAFLMGLSGSLSSSGEIIYSQTASKILNVERMYGAFAGPNELGLYTSIVLILSVYLVIYKNKHCTDITNTIIIVTMLLSTVTLLQTFSRVSWALSFCTVFVLVMNLKFTENIKSLMLMVTIALTLIVIIVTFIPAINEVFTSTVKFEELSTQDRPQQFIDGLERIIKNPLGDGLGLVSYRSQSQVFHTEIYWWIIFLETGVIGGLLLLSCYIIIYFRLKAKFLNNFANVFTLPAAMLSILFVVAGFGSAILLEPIFLAYFWSFIGLGLNKYSSLDNSTTLNTGLIHN